MPSKFLVATFSDAETLLCGVRARPRRKLPHL